MLISLSAFCLLSYFRLFRGGGGVPIFTLSALLKERLSISGWVAVVLFDAGLQPSGW